MDMGRPMSWRGPATAPQRAFRFSLSDAGERDVVAEIGRPNAWNLDVLWRNEFRNTVQMMLYADTGELVLEAAPKIELMVERGDAQIVVMDIETGEERARAPIGASATMGMFLCPGFGRDFYVASGWGPVARIFVA